MSLVQHRRSADSTKSFVHGIPLNWTAAPGYTPPSSRSSDFTQSMPMFSLRFICRIRLGGLYLSPCDFLRQRTHDSSSSTFPRPASIASVPLIFRRFFSTTHVTIPCFCFPALGALLALSVLPAQVFPPGPSRNFSPHTTRAPTRHTPPHPPGASASGHTPALTLERRAGAHPAVVTFQRLHTIHAYV